MNLPLFKLISLLLFWLFLQSCQQEKVQERAPKKPNILFAISDDQSYPYTSIYGVPGIETPNFDRIAKSGVLFHNAFVAAPQCSPSRAAILTGKNIWQLEEAGTHSSYFPKKFTVFTDLLKNNGYKTGYTGKPWGPGNWKDAGWKNNPVGQGYNEIKYEEKHTTGINSLNYAANFEAFLTERNADEPFFFWYGGYEPHRVYQYNSGVEAGKDLEDVYLPNFLPQDSVVLTDIADYTYEIEWFDSHLGKMLDLLEEKGELDNTIVIVTADNGMPFPYAKANLQEFGTHVPLAIAWPDQWEGDRETENLVSMIDIAPTLLEVTGSGTIPDVTGKSLVPLLSDSQPIRDYVLTGRERHTHARPDNLAYPARAIRTLNFLYVRNFKPDRWPAGDPKPSDREDLNGNGFRTFGLGYADVDGSPSKTFLIENEVYENQLFEAAFAKRPSEQLYDILEDPNCLFNLADDESMITIKGAMSSQLEQTLKKQGDPRMFGKGDVIESYPRFAVMRNFDGFKKRNTYNTDFLNNETVKDTISPTLIK